MSRILAVVLLVSALFVACEPTLDSSSRQTWRDSIAEIESDLSEPDRGDFERALEHLAESNSDSPGKWRNHPVEGLDGLTAEEVLERYRERRIEDLEEEIRRLEKQKEKTADARETLEQLEVDSPKLYVEKQKSGRSLPVLEVGLINRTGYTIGKAHFEAVYRPDDREEPWVRDTFAIEIRGGLKSGYRNTWRATKSPFSDWGRVGEKEDSSLHVEPFKILDPRGEVIAALPEETDIASSLEEKRRKRSELRDRE